MARINIEDTLYRDQRFIDLVILVGSADAALGMLVRAWTIAQSFHLIGNRGIPVPEWDKQKLNYRIIEVGLAHLKDGYIRVAGATEHFKWLVDCQAAGVKSAQVRSTKKSEGSLTSVQGSSTSYSYSSSSSLSSSPKINIQQQQQQPPQAGGSGGDCGLAPAPAAADNFIFSDSDSDSVPAEVTETLLDLLEHYGLNPKAFKKLMPKITRHFGTDYRVLEEFLKPLVNKNATNPNRYVYAAIVREIGS